MTITGNSNLRIYHPTNSRPCLWQFWGELKRKNWVLLKLCQQEDKVVENWEKEFNKLMDATTTRTSSMELFYMTEVWYEFLELVVFLIVSLYCLCFLWLATIINLFSVNDGSMFLFLLYCSYKEDADRSIQGDLLLLSGGYVLIIVYVSIVLGNFTRMNIKASCVSTLSFDLIVISKRPKLFPQQRDPAMIVLYCRMLHYKGQEPTERFHMT